MKIMFISFILGIFILSPEYSHGVEPIPSIKIVYEIKPEVEKLVSLTEDKSNPCVVTGNGGLSKFEYSKAFKNTGIKSPLLRDSGDYIKEASKFSQVREALDTKEITRKLRTALIKEFTNRGFPIDNDKGDYLFSFLVNEVSYDDLNGECYLKSVSYQLTKGQGGIYSGVFVSPKKRVLFGEGEVSQLFKVDKVANIIFSEVIKNIGFGNGSFRSSGEGEFRGHNT